MSNFDHQLTQFDKEISKCTDTKSAFETLMKLTDAVVGVKLFTFMKVEMDEMLARRSFTSDEESYPGSGTKPIERNEWFNTIEATREWSVSNTRAEIIEIFPDYELIFSLGCESCVNQPIFVSDKFVGTVNMLNVENHFTPERMALAKKYLPLPAKVTYLLSQSFS
jgi:hypothetical protein